jgi:nucleoside-diphosphate-sugar epimerase
MKLFVTGATGFVGSHFLQEALAKGYDVYALRRQGSQPRIPLNQEPVWIDAALTDDLRATLKDCDAVIHLAAHTPNVPYDTLENCLYWNLSVSLRFFQQAYDAGVRKFLVAGSCFEYGKSAERYTEIPVTATLEPTMSYPTSKAAASIAFYGWAVQMQVQLKILRIFQVFGEGEDPKRLWPSLRRAALAGEDYPMTLGQQVRDFISVEAVAQRFVSELNFEDTAEGSPRIKHVGTGKPQTVLAFSQYWWEQWAAKGKLLPGAVPYRENEVMRFVPECE